MKLLFNNQQLPALTNLLDTLQLPPAPSRARTHLLEALKPHLEAFSRDEYELVSQYAKLKDDGTPHLKADGTITITDPAKATEFHTEHKNLLAETVSVEIADDKANRLYGALEASSQCFAGEQATALNVLITGIENTQGEDKP